MRAISTEGVDLTRPLPPYDDVTGADLLSSVLARAHAVLDELERAVQR